MKKLWVCMFFIMVALLWAAPSAVALAPEELYSRSAVLMDADTGQVLFEKNGFDILYPASITKIMTGLLAAENCPPYQLITVSEQAVNIGVPGSASISLRAGEQLSVEEAMYGMLLASGNDAANALAEHVAGSQVAFANMMTNKAKAIGAKSTVFLNAHGLHEEGHYTTAYDFALITRYACKNPTFLKYFGAPEYIMAGTNTHPGVRTFINYQSMLVGTSAFYDESVIGGKVGFTNSAQHTMSTVAARGGRTLVAVVMYSTAKDHKFRDTQKLLEYGFASFQPVRVPKEEFSGFSVPVFDNGAITGSVFFAAREDFYALIPLGTDPSNVKTRLECPNSFQVGEDMVCTVAFELDDGIQLVPLGTYPLTANMQMDVPRVAYGEPEKRGKTLWGSAPLSVPAVVTAAFFLCAGLLLRREYAIQKRRERRRRREHAPAR